MSPGELAMAKRVSLEHNSMSRRGYKVAYVYDYDTPDPKITFLPDRFWDDPRFTAHDIIERTEFSF